MKGFLFYSLVILLSFLMFSGCDPGTSGSIVGSWSLAGVYDYYMDNPPETVEHTMDMVLVLEADETFSLTGTSKWPDSPAQVVLADGSYDYSARDQTIQMVYINFTLDGADFTIGDQPLCDCVIDGDVMTITFPGIYENSAAEPLVYYRL